jgi:hypothetical protein
MSLASAHQHSSNCCNAHAESELGQKRTNRRGPKSTVVRFGPKADKSEHNWIVRLVP